MFHFINKKSKENKSLVVEDFKQITENLYKQNFEIAQKNKLLSILNKLYEISLLGLNLNGLSDKICLLIQTELSFDLVGIFILNDKKDEFKLVSFADSDRLKKIASKFSLNFYSFRIGKISKSDFLKKVIKSKDVEYTTDIIDILGEGVNKDFVSELKKEGHLKTVIAYPIIIHEVTIGFISICINRKYSDLANYEKDSQKTFANAISSLIDKALLYQELKETNKKLIEANAGQTNLIHIMNHQIKGYLSVNKNIFAELLTDDYGKIPEEAKDIITKGLESSDKGQRYVTDILKGASAENGTLPYDMKSVDFKEVFLNAIENQKKTIEDKKLKLNVDVSDGDYNMIGDSTQLGESVRNLIENSVHYTVFGGIFIHLKRKADKIIFSIKDTGVGVRAEDKLRLFRAGAVGSESRKINVNSSGYGLAFVKGVVEKHNGRVGFESAGYNKGSTFFIELPVK